MGEIDQELQELNAQIHENPELCYREVKAHQNIVSFFMKHKVSVTPHAFGMDTSFLAEYGKGGRVVTFCAEYDALPDIGHACGHNLIATSSIAAFFGVRAALAATKLPGRVRLLGCPAEEGGGGKIRLIEAGAFTDVDAAIMMHPCPRGIDAKDGISFGSCLAATRYKAVFSGLSAHAGAFPWMGINALDAAALSYSALSMLRQHIRPTDRLNVIIEEGGQSTNVIVDRAVVALGVRSATKQELLHLASRARQCFEGAALATQCTVEYVDEMKPYDDLRSNKALCIAFSEYMESIGRSFACDLQYQFVGGYSTDMGNVSYDVPSFHGNFHIPTKSGQNIHSAGFTDAAQSIEAYKMAIEVARGMAAIGFKLLQDEAFANDVWKSFESDVPR
ncbi:amidohydrolase [Penicillium cinerascens]|uniref:Peptidase M20 domain-containing protein 2 n=1 Tax=Penicillium cinerascens TaxID=70096 RepID=A0A9W9M668_9EURO|nr:amidohydrolase [Penicillium cinerascens]KAJ5191246.1 amidohydrolase [Penicillium cinerascens]